MDITEWNSIQNHKVYGKDCGYTQNSKFYPWNKLNFCWICYKKIITKKPLSPPSTPVSSPR